MLGRFMNNIAPCATLVCEAAPCLSFYLFQTSFGVCLLLIFLISLKLSVCIVSILTCRRGHQLYQLPSHPACPPKKHRNAAHVERLLHPRDAHHVNLCGIVTGNVKVCGSLCSTFLHHFLMLDALVHQVPLY